MSKLFDALTSADPISSTVVSDRKISIWGRSLAVPESSGTVARFEFSDLCNKPLSAADYLELTATFPTIFVQSVPRMGLSERDQARRFITFIDGEFSRIEMTCADAVQPVMRIAPNSSYRQKYPYIRSSRIRRARAQQMMRICERVSRPWMTAKIRRLISTSHGRLRFVCGECGPVILILGRRGAIRLCAMRQSTITDGVSTPFHDPFRDIDDGYTHTCLLGGLILPVPRNGRKPSCIYRNHQILN